MLAKGKTISHAHSTYARHLLPLRCPRSYFISPVSTGNAVESSVKAMSLRLLIAHPRFSWRNRLCRLLSQEAGYIDEVSTVNALGNKLHSTSFDLVIAHHSLVPDITILPGDHFVLLVAQPDKTLFQAAREHGALAYLSENPPESLLLATLDLKPGDFLLDPAFARWALNKAARSSEPLHLLNALTKQEQKIVMLREEGRSLSEIADRLCIEIAR